MDHIILFSLFQSKSAGNLVFFGFKYDQKLWAQVFHEGFLHMKYILLKQFLGFIKCSADR
jgi:hypothetical protein